MITRIILILICLFAKPVCAETLVLGDQIGTGIRPYLIPKVSDQSYTMAGVNTELNFFTQIKAVPKDWDIMLFLGLNENPNRKGFYDGILRVLEQALINRTGRVIWVGPPCSPNLTENLRLGSIDLVLSMIIHRVNQDQLRYVSLFRITSEDVECSMVHRDPESNMLDDNGYRAIANLINQWRNNPGFQTSPRLRYLP